MLLQVVLDTMKGHSYHGGVVSNACGALWQMTCVAGTRATIIAHGGVAATLAAKRNHPGDASLQTNAVGLLAALQ